MKKMAFLSWILMGSLLTTNGVTASDQLHQTQKLFNTEFSGVDVLISNDTDEDFEISFFCQDASGISRSITVPAHSVFREILGDLSGSYIIEVVGAANKNYYSWYTGKFTGYSILKGFSFSGSSYFDMYLRYQ